MTKHGRMQKQGRKGRSPSSQVATLSLGQIAQLGRNRQWQEAFEALSIFLQRYPKNITALEMMGDAAHKIGNVSMMWFSAWQLHQLQPNNAVHLSNLVMAAMANSMPFSVVHYAAQFMSRWPKDPLLADVRATHQRFEPICREIRKGEPDHANHSDSDMALTEEAQQLVSHGHYVEGRKVNLRAAERMPELAAPRNNLVLTYVLEGNFPEALRIARETCERFPNNFHARCNLAQILLRTGERAAARQQMTGLPALSDLKFDDKIKWVETLAYMGDDEQQVKLYEQLQQDKELWSHLPAMTRHLLAVSLARAGDIKQAQKLWKEAFQDNPRLDEVRENLDDLKKKPGERNGPWPFPISYWIPRQWVVEMSDAVFGITDEDTLQRKLGKLLKDRPTLLAAIPMLLERGDPAGRQFALHMASIIPVEGLKEFVLSLNGTDQERVMASEYAAEYGLLPRNTPLMIWQAGEQKEILLLGFEIDDEPGPPIEPPAAQELFQQSYDAYHEKDHAEALRYAEEALKLAPDAPEVMNQVAAMLELNGRKSEGYAITRQLATQYPDYLFGRVGMARLLTQEKKFDEARAWILPLIERSRFHFSEFRALQMAQVELLLAEENFDGVEKQLAMWQDVDPDAPQIEHFQMQLMLKQIPARLAKLTNPFKRRGANKKRKK